MEAKDTQTGTFYKASSIATGRYSIEDLPPGKYEVTVAVAGLKSWPSP